MIDAIIARFELARPCCAPAWCATSADRDAHDAQIARAISTLGRYAEPPNERHQSLVDEPEDHPEAPLTPLTSASAAPLTALVPAPLAALAFAHHRFDRSTHRKRDHDR